MAYEEANYEIVKENKEYEIRKYSDRLVIETNSIQGNGASAVSDLIPVLRRFRAPRHERNYSSRAQKKERYPYRSLGN